MNTRGKAWIFFIVTFLAMGTMVSADETNEVIESLKQGEEVCRVNLQLDALGAFDHCPETYYIGTDVARRLKDLHIAFFDTDGVLMWTYQGPMPKEGYLIIKVKDHFGFVVGFIIDPYHCNDESVSHVGIIPLFGKWIPDVKNQIQSMSEQNGVKGFGIFREIKGRFGKIENGVFIDDDTQPSLSPVIGLVVTVNFHHMVKNK